MKDFSNHFRELVKRQLGDDPRILVPRGAQDMMILATWRLSSDALRPNKRSRMIRIVIAQKMQSLAHLKPKALKVRFCSQDIGA